MEAWRLTDRQIIDRLHWLTDWLTDHWLTDWMTLLTMKMEGIEWSTILFTFVLFALFFLQFYLTNLYDDTWQHVCLTWENTQGVAKLYKDGQFAGQVTNNATENFTLTAGGFLVLGQDQDSIGGGFIRRQTLRGRLASVNMWDKVLSESDMPLSTQIAAYLMVLFLTGLYSKILLMAMSQSKSREVNCLEIKHSRLDVKFLMLEYIL